MHRHWPGRRGLQGGIDALGEVTVRIDADGRVYSGNAATTDVVVSSARAYVNALNRLKANKADVGAEYARAQV